MPWRGGREQKGGQVLPFALAVSKDKQSCASHLMQREFRAQEARLVAYLALRLGSHAEAQDAAQTVFLRLWERSAEIRVENLTALIFVTARNLAIDLLRARARASTRVDSDTLIGLVEDDSPSADRIVSARDDLRLIGQILQDLPEKCRTAFIRNKFDGAGFDEIAAEMGVSQSMVRKYVLRGMAHCAVRFSQMEGWE